jgi:hypothetical protein
MSSSGSFARLPPPFAHSGRLGVGDVCGAGGIFASLDLLRLASVRPIEPADDGIASGRFRYHFRPGVMPAISTYIWLGSAGCGWRRCRHAWRRGRDKRSRKRGYSGVPLHRARSGGNAWSISSATWAHIDRGRLRGAVRLVTPAAAEVVLTRSVPAAGQVASPRVFLVQIEARRRN